MNISTLRKVLVSLGQIFKYTARHGYMDYNPLLAERPKARNRSFKKAARILSIKEIGAFLDAIDIPKYKTLFMLTIASGARQGELLGLRWSDVDWENSQIHIQRSYNNQNCYDPKNSRQTEELI